MAFAKKDSQELDRGDLVSTIIMIAGFAIVALLLVNWLGTAILNKGADAAGCIEGANSYNSQQAAQNCQNQNHAENNSFQKDDGYKGRFGTIALPEALFQS